MTRLLQSTYNLYKYISVDMEDPRLKNYPLMTSPLPLLGIVLFYLYFVKILGPKLMANRKPFELKNTITIYNAVQVVTNFALGTWGTYELVFKQKFDWSCHLPNYNDDEEGRTHLLLFYCYFLLKLLDFTDTIFFVLRKKFNQITFLHVYHHCGISIGTYICAKYYPGGHVSLLGMINTFVHVIMYSYYLLTIIKPEFKRSVWWKKYITQVQLLQFAILVVHFLRPIFAGKKCLYPKFVTFIAGTQNFFMLILFIDFYIRTYYKSKKTINKKLE